MLFSCSALWNPPPWMEPVLSAEMLKFFSFARAWNVLLKLSALLSHFHFSASVLSSDKECSLEHLNHFNFHLICLNYDSVIWLSLHRIHGMCFFWMKIKGGLQEFTQYTSCCCCFCQSIEPERNYCEVKPLEICRLGGRFWELIGTTCS